MNTSRTAEFMALFRALENGRPVGVRLFDDPLAIGFLRPAFRWVVRLARVPRLGAAVPWVIDRRWPGARTSGVARTRLIDDMLADALAAGARRVVVLGAGFDCRGYRLPRLRDAQVFEVDHPATQGAKRERLRRLLGELPRHVVFVALDFARQDLAPALRAAGFDEAAGPTFFMWEGVTNYLTASAVDTTLRAIVALAAPGDRLVFTYVHRGFLEGSLSFPGTVHLLATLQRVGEPWTFGLDPTEVGDFLAERSLSLLEDWGAADYRARYMGPAAGQMRGYEFYRASLAEVM
jgi:methyltransferase (TIGR00027 family)